MPPPLHPRSPRVPVLCVIATGCAADARARRRPPRRHHAAHLRRLEPVRLRGWVLAPGGGLSFVPPSCAPSLPIITFHRRSSYRRPFSSAFHPVARYPRIVSEQRGPNYLPKEGQSLSKPLGYIPQVQSFENVVSGMGWGGRAAVTGARSFGGFKGLQRRVCEDSTSLPNCSDPPGDR